MDRALLGRMATPAIAAIGASSGGIEALRNVFLELPADFPAAILVVVHIPDVPSALPESLEKSCSLPVRFARDSDTLAAGEVRIAPPGHHLLVYGDVLRALRGPRENGFIPAIDPLFRSAARSAGERVAGVVLSGALDDGAAGMRELRQRGGATLVQDPREADFPNMPEAAIQTGSVDHVLPAKEIGRWLTRWARARASDLQIRSPDAGEPALTLQATDLTCPDCGGVLRETVNAAPLTCHVGHTFSHESLVASQNAALDRALWAAIRALRESAMLRRRMADRAHKGGLTGLARAYESHADESDRRAAAIREVVTSEGSPPVRMLGGLRE